MTNQTSNARVTLPGTDYHDEAIFELERKTIFHRVWYCVGRVDALQPGDRQVVDIAGESVLIVCDRELNLYAHANVCRHRGAQLCAESGPGPKGSITCPYHAFSYAMDGRMIATPNVDPAELDRSELSLWKIALETWQGFIFVSLAADPPTLLEWFASHPDTSPLQFARHEMASLRSGRRTVSEVDANWKILVENYMECLHCPKVHPELVDVVPFYRDGSVTDVTRADGGVALLAGGTGFTPGGQSSLPTLRSMTASDVEDYFGLAVFPNLMLDITGTCIMATMLHPRSAGHTTVVTEYLFDPDVVDAPGFDPSPVVDFNELVGRQDYEVCEMVQRGVRSSRFTHGVLAEKDSLITEVNVRYLSERAG